MRGGHAASELCEFSRLNALDLHPTFGGCCSFVLLTTLLRETIRMAVAADVEVLVDAWDPRSAAAACVIITNLIITHM